MRLWDLSSGAGRLEQAMKELTNAQLRIVDQWSDQTYHEFREHHLEPIDPLVRRTLEAVRRMAEVLAKAERDCGSY